MHHYLLMMDIYFQDFNKRVGDHSNLCLLGDIHVCVLHVAKSVPARSQVHTYSALVDASTIANSCTCRQSTSRAWWKQSFSILVSLWPWTLLILHFGERVVVFNWVNLHFLMSNDIFHTDLFICYIFTQITNLILGCFLKLGCFRLASAI